MDFLKKDIKPSMAGLSILFVTYIIGYLGELVADKIEFIKNVKSNSYYFCFGDYGFYDGDWNSITIFYQ